MSDVAARSDEELVRVARSDPDAFDELFRRHAVRLEAWFRARVPDREIAADLVAETFAQALVAATRFRGVRTGSASAWLNGIARNLLRQYYRRNKGDTRARRRLALLLPDVVVDAAELITDEDDVQRVASALRHALLQLPLDQRTAIELRILRQESYDVVASHLECTNAAARMKV